VRLKTSSGAVYSSSGGTVTLGTTAGSLGAVADHGDGTYTASLIAPTTIGSAVVSGQLNGQALTSRDTVSFTAGSVTLTKSTLTVADSVLTADGTSTTVATVHTKDAFGNPVTSGVGTVTMQTTLGALGAVTQSAPDAYVATLTTVTSTGVASLTAKIGGQPLTTGASVRFAPGSVALFVVEAAGGGAIPTQRAGHAFAVRITAKDAHGNVASGFSGTVVISSTGSLSRGSGTTGAFVSGVVTSYQVTIADGGSFTVTATRSGGVENGTSNSFLVQPGILAFYSARNGGAEIMLINADGSGETQLTPNGSSDDQPAWSTDGVHIAFSRAAPAIPNIVIMDSAGASSHAITSGGWLYYNPAWSPDNSRIAMQVNDGSLAGSRIYVLNADGSGLMAVTDSAVNRRHPAWTPDGASIVAGRLDSIGTHIVRMHSDGTSEIQLTTGNVFDDEPAVSPDGSKIAFVRSDSVGSSFGVFVMNSDGSGAHLLAATSSFEGSPTWSPDGSRIAFYKSISGLMQIFTLHADGSGLVQVTHTATNEYEPAWRP
jgi:Tol biopolymer transport system component